MNKPRKKSQVFGNVTASPAANDRTKHRYIPYPEVSTLLNSSSSETNGHKKTRSMSGSSKVIGEEGLTRRASVRRASAPDPKPSSAPD